MVHHDIGAAVHDARKHGKLRDELLNGDIFYTLLREAKVLIERWRQHYNTIRPHGRSATDHPHPSRSCRRWSDRRTLKASGRSHSSWTYDQGQAR